MYIKNSKSVNWSDGVSESKGVNESFGVSHYLKNGCDWKKVDAAKINSTSNEAWKALLFVLMFYIFVTFYLLLLICFVVLGLPPPS